MQKRFQYLSEVDVWINEAIISTESTETHLHLTLTRAEREMNTNGDAASLCSLDVFRRGRLPKFMEKSEMQSILRWELHQNRTNV